MGHCWCAARFPRLLSWPLQLARQFGPGQQTWLALCLPMPGFRASPAVLLLEAALCELPRELEEKRTAEGFGLMQASRWILVPLLGPAWRARPCSCFCSGGMSSRIALTWLSV